MKHDLSIVLTVILLLVTFSCSKHKIAEDNKVNSQSKKFEQPAKPRNIVLMIGDGMGLTQITGGMLANENRLNLERIKHIGLSKTSSSREVITDSAAGATAFSIGEKTYNGAIGVDSLGVAKENILEELEKKGYASGLIATCNITHATPASFYAHQPKRSMYYQIAEDLANSEIDVIVGSGLVHLEDRTEPIEEFFDDRNLVTEMKQKGFSFVHNLAELQNSEGRAGYFYSYDHPPSVLDGRDDILPRSVHPVVEKLEQLSDKGFFLVVEGSQIDWGGHANNSEMIIAEMIDFDKAVGQVLDFAEKNGETLVIITADHETGGYALRDVEGDYKKMTGSFSTGGHTATMVPVFAYGPGAELFTGMYENTAIYYKMKQALGL